MLSIRSLPIAAKLSKSLVIPRTTKYFSTQTLQPSHLPTPTQWEFDQLKSTIHRIENVALKT
jgi:hypothetical protein